MPPIPLPSCFVVINLVSSLAIASAAVPKGPSRAASYRQFVPPQVLITHCGLRCRGGELTEEVSPVESFRGDRPEGSWEDPEILQKWPVRPHLSRCVTICQSVNTQVVCDNLLICFTPTSPQDVSLLPSLLICSDTCSYAHPVLFLAMSIARVPSTVAVYLCPSLHRTMVARLTRLFLMSSQNYFSVPG